MSSKLPKVAPGRSPLQGAWRASAGGLTAVLVFGAFINLLKFAMPLYTLQILDRIPSSRSIETLVMLTLIALLAVIAGVALEAIRSRLFGSWGGWIERRFGPTLVAAGLGNGNGAADSGASPSADNGLRDLRTLRSFVERAAAPLLDLMWAPLFVVAVYLVHPLLGALMLGAIALRLSLALVQEALIREPRRAAGDARDYARDIVTDAQRNADTVGALGMAANLTRRWHGSVSTRLEERDRAGARSDLMAALDQGLYRLLYVGGMGAGIWLVILGELTIGGVIAGNIIMRFGFRLVGQGARRWRMLTRARGAYRRVKTQLAILDSSAAASGTSMTAADLDAPLRVERVSYRYPGAREAIVKRLDLNLARGELLSVMGPSGSGKSTFAQLLAGRLVPRHGQILLGDVAVARLPDTVKAGFAGYLPQHPALFNGSVRDNIARMDLAHVGEGSDGGIDTGIGIGMEAVIDAAKLADIHDAIVRLPQGYDTVLDSDAPGLSGGERKRIALARAFYGRPRLVVLDEPEAALDRASRRVLRRALQTLAAAGSTVVVITQSGRLARSADRSLILGGDRPQLVDAAEAAAPVPASVENLDRRRQRRQSSQATQSNQSSQPNRSNRARQPKPATKETPK